MPDSRRWSDEKLDEFHQEFLMHTAKEEAFMEQFTSVQNSNTESIRRLTISNAEIAKNTGDMVDAWKNAKGALKVGATLGHFFKWLSGFAIIGVILEWLSSH